MKKIFCFSFVLLFAICAFSQKKGYKISVKIDGTQDTMLLLGNYYGNQQYVQDTAFINKKGWFVFEKKDKEIFTGMYFICTSEKHYFDIVMGNEAINFTFETKTNDYVNSMKVSGSTDNTLFYDFWKLNAKTGLIIDSLRNKAPNADSVANKEKIKQTIENIENYVNNFKKEHPTHMLTYIFNSSEEINIPKTLVNENGEPDRLAQYRYYCEHYFDYIALDYDGMVRTPSHVFYDKLDNYFEKVLRGLPVDTIMVYADMVIEKSRPSKEMFKYLVWYLADKYLKSTVMGYEAIYVHIIQKYYATGQAFWASPSAIEEEVTRANRWEKLLLGKPAQELETKDMNGAWHSLYGVKAKYTLLVFWSPNCGHCSTLIPEFHKFYLENKDKYGLEVFSVDTELGHRDNWIEFSKKHGLKWINTYGDEANMDWRDAYDVTKTPVIYLFDENKTIIGKAVDPELLRQILDDREKREKEEK